MTRAPGRFAEAVRALLLTYCLCWVCASTGGTASRHRDDSNAEPGRICPHTHDVLMRFSSTDILACFALRRQQMQPAATSS